MVQVVQSARGETLKVPARHLVQVVAAEFRSVLEPAQAGLAQGEAV